MHSDLCGPIHKDIEFKYLLTLTDDYTHYTWVCFLRLKSDTFQHFKDFVKLVKTQFSQKVHSMTHTEHDWSNTVANLRSDRGGEYLSAEFTSYLVQKRIQRQLTTVDTPHQNGISERKNRTLMEATRFVFNSRKYLVHLWTECTRVVNYVLNRSGIRALNLTTPFEKLYGPICLNFEFLGARRMSTFLKTNAPS